MAAMQQQDQHAAMAYSMGHQRPMQAGATYFSILPSPSRWTFTQGLIVGQISMVVIALLLIRYVIFEDSATALEKERLMRLKISERRSKRHAKALLQGARRATTASAPSSTTNPLRKSNRISSDTRASTFANILDKTAYDISSHLPESADWLNVMFAQAIAGYREDVLAGGVSPHPPSYHASPRHGSPAIHFASSDIDPPAHLEPEKERTARDLMEEILNRASSSFLDPIRVTEADFGDAYPIFTNARVRPADDTGRTRIEIDVDYSDQITLAIDTKLLINFPKPRAGHDATRHTDSDAAGARPLDEEAERIDEARFIDCFEGYANLVAASSTSADHAAIEIERYQGLKRYLTRLGERMAEHPGDRPAFVKDDYFKMWIRSLANFYPTFERAQADRPSPTGDGDETTWTAETEKKDDLYHRVSILTMLCMRVLRNIMADNSEAQVQVSVQMLSNLITNNSDVQDEMWPRIVTTDKDEHKLVLKFLSSPDTGTSSAAQVLLINFLRAPNSNGNTHRRCYELCTSPQGLQILESLLSSSQSIMLRIGEPLKDDPEFDNEWEGLEDSLGFIWTIFSVLFDQGYSSMLVSAMAPMEETTSLSTPSDTQLITNSQPAVLQKTGRQRTNSLKTDA
ncbi:hypothetical protein NDA16_000015 [Ustilago loliicola]|nr:hypothetical protein NDA16_000015 [Ustilago loliicola]